MPESLVSGALSYDGPAAYYALIAVTSTGKRGCDGSLLADELAAGYLGVDVRTVERWRRILVAADYLTVTPEGRRRRKHARKAFAREQFVMVPALVMRAMLTGAISALAFRVWAWATSKRIETGERAGCWRGTAALARDLRRDEPTIAAAVDELVDAALMRRDDFGPGLPRRLEPQFARPVTQALGAAVQKARRYFHHITGYLRKPQLAETGTPPARVGYTPPSDVGYQRHAAGRKAQVEPGSHAPRPGRDLSGGDLNVSPPDWALLAHYAPWAPLPPEYQG